MKLNHFKQGLYLLIAYVLVAFGQPAWSQICSILSAMIGYAFVFRVVLDYDQRAHRFLIGTLWFTAVQMTQLSWLISHPFTYIYAIWPIFSLLIGLQFGVVALFIRPAQLQKWSRLIALAGLWTLIEWSRLFFLSGYTWNPIGLSLSATLYSLQMASLWGVYGLTFWVILVNLIAVKAWTSGFAKKTVAIWIVAAATPYLYGVGHLYIHQQALHDHFAEDESRFKAVLVQTAFPVEEALGFWDTKNMIHFVIDEWRQILNITSHHYGTEIDLITLPEFVVPFGTWTPVYPYEKVVESFEEVYGSESLKKLPPLASPFARETLNARGEKVWLVSNAFWLQGIANLFDAHILAGLEDVDVVESGKKEFYSAALHFQPLEPQEENPKYVHVPVNRYEKRVLVPMGEYIPFSFLVELAKEYGVFGSFTPGRGAKVFPHHKLPFGISICYEETFGDLMRESRLLGAELLVNITSDVWYPNSRLPKQHFDHARLRSVESGIPLIRACNTGITCGVDSLGQMVAVLGDTPYEQEWSSDSLKLEVPRYTYRTLYSRVGDSFILGIAFVFVGFTLRKRDFKF